MKTLRNSGIILLTVLLSTLLAATTRFDVVIIGSPAGVQLSGDGDGALTFLGLGNGSDEDLTLNLDDTSNTWVFTSSTGVNAATMSGVTLTAAGFAGSGAGLTSIPIGTAFADLLEPDLVWLRDDFIGGSTTGSSFGAIGELGWSVASITGAHASEYITGEANRWGLYRCQSNTTTNDGAQLALNWTGGGFNKVQRIPALNATTGWAARFIARINSTAACNFRIGLMDDPQSALPANGMWIEYEAASDTFFTAVCRAAGTETESVTAVTADTGWHVFDISCSVSGTISFSVDGGSAVTIATNVPSAALCPSMIIQTTTTAAKSADIDFFGLRATVAR